MKAKNVRFAPPSAHPHMTRTEVAQELGYSTSFLDHWAHHGRGPTYYRGVRNGAAVALYRREDVDAYKRALGL